MLETFNSFTLRIKKKYLLEILSGKKTIEYRDFKPFYFKLKNKEITHIKFHYQSKEFWIVPVLKIKIIKTPEFLKNCDVKFSDKVFAIHLKYPSK